MVRCFILLGGQGTRLFPLTNFIHKSMIPIMGRPVIEHIISHLKNQDITDIVLCVSNLANKEQFTHYFGNGSRFGVTLKYSVGTKKLKTAERILLASHQNLVNGEFIVYYGDILTNLDLRKVCEFHREKGGIGTIVFSPTLPIPSGIGVVDERGQIEKIQEKPLLPHNTNIGIYVLEPEILKYIKTNHDFFADTFPQVIRNKERLYGYVSNCKWLDIGSFQSLQSAETFVKKNFRGRCNESDMLAYSDV